MNKKHWYTVCLDCSLDDAELLKLVDISYEEVKAGKTKHRRLSGIKAGKGQKKQ